MDIVQYLISSGKQSQSFIPLAIISAAFLDSFIFVGILINGVLLLTVSLFFYINNAILLREIIIFAFIGSLIGDQSGYILGKLFGVKILNNRIFGFKRRYARKAYDLVEKWGPVGVFLGRFISPLRSVTPFACATLNMPYRKFTFANIFTCVVWTLFWSAFLWMIAAGYKFSWIPVPDVTGY